MRNKENDFQSKTITNLAKRVNYLCSNPLCRKLTSGPNSIDNKSTLIGVAAHITAAGEGGPRYKSKSPEECRNFSNGIWLCHNCSDLVDKDELRFTESILKDWKNSTEKFVLDNISSTNPSNKTYNNELVNILKRINTSNKLSPIIADLFEISILNNLTELNEICTRELNGWYAADLPTLDSTNAAKYRVKEVYYTKGKIKINNFNGITIKQLLHELNTNEKFTKVNFLFHEPIFEIELNIKRLPENEECLLTQEIQKGFINYQDHIIDKDLTICYSSLQLLSIEVGLRQEFNRIITKILNTQN